MKKKWTEEDIKILKAALHVQPVSETAKILGRSEYAVRKKMYKIGLHVQVREQTLREHDWKEDEVKTLKDSVKQGLSTSEISELLGRTEDSIRAKAARIELVLNSDAWSDREVQKLESLMASKVSWPKIAKKIGRTQSACRKKANSLMLQAHLKPGWTTQDERALVEYKQQGLSWQDISDKMGRTKHSIQKKYLRMGS
jgi:IS30 family transposase